MDFLGFEKILYHPEKLEKLRQDEPQFPVHMTISLGNFCNHACLWCTVYAVQQEQVRHMDYDKLIEFLSRAQERGLRAVGYVGNGEPTAYPKFRELTKAVNAMGLEQGMFTNGHLLDRYMDEVLNYFTYIRISLDAGSVEVHDAMHDVKGHFPKIISNLDALIKKRDNGYSPTIGVQYATHHLNLHDLYNSARIVSEIGVDYFSVKPVFNWGGGANPDRIERNTLTYESLTPEVNRARADFENQNFKIMYRPHQVESVSEDRNILEYDRCVAGLFNLNLYENGKLTCCSPHRVEVGTYEDDPQNLEKTILETTKGLDLSKCPPSCRYHPLNHLVDTVVNPERARQFHHNFL